MHIIIQETKNINNRRWVAIEILTEILWHTHTQAQPHVCNRLHVQTFATFSFLAFDFSLYKFPFRRFVLFGNCMHLILCRVIFIAFAFCDLFVALGFYCNGNECETLMSSVCKTPFAYSNKFFVIFFLSSLFSFVMPSNSRTESQTKPNQNRIAFESENIFNSLIIINIFIIIHYSCLWHCDRL